MYLRKLEHSYHLVNFSIDVFLFHLIAYTLVILHNFL